MTIEEYRKALKLGKKHYRACILSGESPYLPVLEQMLQNTTIVTQESLGIIEIPLEQIIGTYYNGRQPTFTHGFLPLMEERTEFAQKWIGLCSAHLDTGIHDPIVAYEFMNKFYVVEGHKRVSVLKHFGAFSLRGSVTRMIPQPDDSKESHIYSEFLRFYQITGINFICFHQEGGFDALLDFVDPSEHKIWDAQSRSRFHSFCISFRTAYKEIAGTRLSLTVGDAMLLYLKIYSYASSADKTSVVIRQELSRMWTELCNRNMDADINLVLKPSEYKPLFPAILTNRLRIAFIYDKTPETSSWTYAHELGRRDLEAALGNQIETSYWDNADTEDKAAKALETAISNRSDLIFTASSNLLNVSVKTALEHPKAKILNCSLNTTHPSVRTYHVRMYEVKFLMGMIAGCLTPNDTIGYIADYPIYGTAANINAFALGAKTVNPHAKIMLQWSKTREAGYREHLDNNGISYVSDHDMITPDMPLPYHVGLYHFQNDTLSNIALPVFRWGNLYQRIVQNYLNGGWKADISGTRAINYWWGMDAGVVDFICSRSLPKDTLRLINLVRDAIISGSFSPFSSILTKQDGSVLDYQNHPITSEDIITMNWLSDNVIGSFPTFDQLLPEAQSLVRIQGIRNTEQ